MEDQMEKMLENHMETGGLLGIEWDEGFRMV